MHQQSRHPPRVSSPASSPQTNPTRTNNPREALSSATRARASSEGGGYDGSAISSGTSVHGSGPSRESIKKLDQIVQNLYQKAAILVLQSRLNLPPSNRRPNKWFQLETDELDGFRDELRVYRTSGTFENRPPPMIIETYIDASRLSSSQSLVVTDDYGKRWDVLEALNTSETSTDDNRNTEVILERWRIELKCVRNEDDVDDFGSTLPTIYKKAIVFFRSLFVATRIMPCWKYSQQAFAKAIHPALEVKCRILTTVPEYTSFDPLRQPLFDGRDAVTDYMFGDLEVPVGRFYASVTYRNDCNFRVDDSESLLSSRFMGVDENFFKPSIGTHRRDQYGEVGSLPSQRQGRGAPEPHQTYGSLSTFHGEGALGTSPMTALKAVKAVGSDTSSPPTSSPAASIGPEPPHSLPIRGSAVRPPLRGLDGTNRRPSVSFQPFKAGSLSGSPRLASEMDAPSSPGSLTRPSGLSGGISQARNRSSLTAGMAASLRAPANPPAEVVQVASSPKPTSRYSSSFTHRRARPSYGGQSKADDDQISSGKQSLSSSAAQPGSGLLTEIGGNASSGSFQTDDDNNISDFLKALDSRKTLASFEPTSKKGESSAKRTANQLYKFHLMKESNNVLTESMTSSVHLVRSSVSSSGRGFAAVPVTASMSIGSGSSPGAGGKPLSPHTPHTPAIPSRLSENEIVEYQGQERAVEEGDGETPQAGREGRTIGAIDIPLSPRVLAHHGIGGSTRRASSVAQRSLVSGGGVDGGAEEGMDEEEGSGLGQRSISLGADGREAPSRSTLLALGVPGAGGGGGDEVVDEGEHGDGYRKNKSSGRGRYQGSEAAAAGGGSHQGQRYGGNLLLGRVVGAAAIGGEDVGGDEEPLLFAMSELERGPSSRRSLEGTRGGIGGGSGRDSREGERRFEPKGTSKRGWP